MICEGILHNWITYFHSIVYESYLNFVQHECSNKSIIVNYDEIHQTRSIYSSQIL